VIAPVVVQNRIRPAVGREQERERRREQDPADRIARLAPRDDVADDAEGDDDDPLREVVTHDRHDPGSGDQQHDHDAEDERSPRRREPSRAPQESAHVLAQMETCAGSSDPRAAAASSLSTVSGSTASRNRVPNVATSSSAS